jgi:hypothetical protein
VLAAKPKEIAEADEPLTAVAEPETADAEDVAEDEAVETGEADGDPEEEA